MSVKLRKKKISKGRFSLYSDIYHNGERSYDFLELYLEKSKSDESKENLAAAKKIRLAVEHQLAISKRNVPNEGKLNTCFLKYIEVKYKGKGKDRFNAVVGRHYSQRVMPSVLVKKANLYFFSKFIPHLERDS